MYTQKRWTCQNEHRHAAGYKLPTVSWVCAASAGHPGGLWGGGWGPL